MDEIKPDSVLLLDDAKITRILNADNSLDLLLTRLKQSILTCDELAKFIKKKLIFEDEHYNQMRKVGRNTRELLKHDSRVLRQDSFIRSFDDIVAFDDKLFNVGTSYVKLLTQMYDQLVSLSSTITRSRKSVKEEGRRKEKECMDAIAALEKLKNKYHNLCLELEKLKSSDPSKKTFTLKGSKTSSQQEEDVLKKIEIANLEYKNKVVHCKKLKDELLKFHRPSNSKQLKNLILEIDTAISAQLQKYSTWNETLYMNSGVTISPLKLDVKKPSMRNIASSVDNEKDLYNYLLKNGAHQNRSLVTVEYQVHPSFGGTTSAGLSSSSSSSPLLKSGNGFKITTPSFGNTTTAAAAATTTAATATVAAVNTPKINTSIPPPPIPQQQLKLVFTQQQQINPTAGPIPPPVPQQQIRSMLTDQAPSYSSLDPASSKIAGPRPMSPVSDIMDDSDDSDGKKKDTIIDDEDGQDEGEDLLPPGTRINSKTFGVPIVTLLSSEDDLVPDIVTRCISIIEQYGLDLEGLYRISANATKLKELKELIDLDPLNLNTIGPNSGNTNNGNNNNTILDSDVYCVASLLKLFFASLPEPLLTNDLYLELINAARIPDQNERYITLHHIIFKLPDESYWTLRLLILHLSKVVLHSDKNKMSEKNLGIVWGPTLMSSSAGGTDAEEITLQGKVVEELIINANNLYRDD